MSLAFYVRPKRYQETLSLFTIFYMFTEFPTQSTTEWLDAIQKVLKGQSIETLQTALYEGFSIQPFYDEAHARPALLNEADFLPTHFCQNIVPIYAQNLNEDIQLAQELVQKGADAIQYIFREAPQNINAYITKTTVPFGIKTRHKIEPKEGRGNWKFLETATLDATAIHQLAAPDRKLAHVDLQVFDEAGSSATQTLAFGLNKLVETIETLTAAGLSTGEAFAQIFVTISTGGNYFVEIAKLRALRVLWRNILEAYKVQFIPLVIHASATQRNKVREDSYNNLLRNTTEAMASIIGGADAFMALPYNSPFSFIELFDKEEITFAQRIARNTLVLLKEEAHLDKVLDISAGSYYLEELTYQLTERGWSLFQQVEARDGFSNAKIWIDEEIAHIAKKRKDDFETGKAVLVGVNRYQNPADE